MQIVNSDVLSTVGDLDVVTPLQVRSSTTRVVIHLSKGVYIRKEKTRPNRTPERQYHAG